MGTKDEVVPDNVIRIALNNNSYHEVIPLFDPPHLLKAFRNGLLERDCQFNYRSSQGQFQGVAKWDYLNKTFDINQEKTGFSVCCRILQRNMSKRTKLKKLKFH